MLGWIEYEKSFITLGSELCQAMFTWNDPVNLF